MSIETLESRINQAETVLIALTIIAIAAADYFVGPQTSLGPLYLVPLCYSALAHPRRVTFALFLVCLMLRQWLGPLEASSDPWFFFFRDLSIAAAFVATAAFLSRLGAQRREFFDLAQQQRDELASEVDLAAMLQRRLLKLNQAPEGDLDIAARTVQLKGVGGDYYDFVDLGERQTGVVIADIAGKGIQAALLMPAVRIALRSIVQRHHAPADIVAELDRIIYRTTEPQNYATLLFASIDLDTGQLSYVNAGHLPGLLVDPDGSVHWLQGGGPPVGILPTAQYTTGHAILRPGGNLILYTDGVTESTNRAGEEFGNDRVTEIARRVAGMPSSAVVDAVRREIIDYVDGGELADDASVIAIRRPPDAADEQRD